MFSFSFPVLFSIGPMAISTLGVLSVLAFLAGTFWLWKKCKDEGFDEEKLLDVAFLGAVVGLITGRIGYILEAWPKFGLNPGRWVDFQHLGGLSFFGAAAGAFLIIWWLGKKYKWSFWVFSDLAVFGLIISQ